jgi:cbb3-type cytochrome oxidase cytochrome c subunit
MKFTKKLDLSVLGWFALLSCVLVVLLGFIAFKEESREWKNVQKQYYAVEQKVAAAQGREVAPQKLALKQVMVKDLGAVDRCITCHVGIDDPNMTKEAVIEAGGNYKVFAQHPDFDTFMGKHPVDKFSCTTCHQGQGLATTAADAHGFVHKWDFPMLGDNHKDEMTKYAQASCATCHSNPNDWEKIGANKLAEGRKIVNDYGCVSCHKIEGKGGIIGPDLTTIGDKLPSQFHAALAFEPIKQAIKEGKFQGVSKDHQIHDDAATWHDFHFMNPQAVSPGSTMPAYGFTKEQREALITWIFAQKKRNVPASYLIEGASGGGATPAKTEAKAEPAKVAAASGLNGLDLFGAKTCGACHTMTGVPGAVGAVGPSLDGIGKTRDAAWLAKWLKDPAAVKPGTTMPNLGLSDDEAKAIAEFIASK